MSAGLPVSVAVVIELEDQFLMIRRAQEPFVGSWSPVTGRVEPGESVAEAAVREVQEELGVSVEAGETLYVCPSADGSVELHFIRARWLSGDPVGDPAEVLEWRWLTFEEMSALDRFETDSAAFRRLAKIRNP